MPAERMRALWTGAPWTIRVFIAIGAIAQVVCAISYQSPYIAISALIFLAASHLLLKGARWAWLATVALLVTYFVLFVYAGWFFFALCYVVYLALLLAPPSRRHYADERSEPSGDLSSRLGRLRASPATLKAFAAVLLVYYGSALGFLLVEAAPGRLVLAIALAAAIFAALGFFVAQGARVAWSLAIALIALIAAPTIANGHWGLAAVHVVLLLLLLLPGSVAFVWRDRRATA